MDQEAETSQDDIDADRDETIARRATEIVNGTARLADGREARDRIRAELSARRTSNSA